MFLILVHFSVKWLIIMACIVALPKPGWRFFLSFLSGCVSFFYGNVAVTGLKDTNDRPRLFYCMGWRLSLSGQGFRGVFCVSLNFSRRGNGPMEHLHL